MKTSVKESDNQTEHAGFNRRALIRGAITAAAAGTATPAMPAAASKAPAAGSRNTIVASYSKAIVETTAGKVRGYTQNGIYTFKGIPYGAPTDGAARFMAPAKPTPWSGVRSSLHYGHSCPNGVQLAHNGNNESRTDEDAFLLYRTSPQAGEDCLRVNIWTPEINGSKKRPVMVYMHGGGFSGGSGHILLSDDGENLSSRGDVVVVSHNHRLNIFGYLNLAGLGGEQYAKSANVGMRDLVAVLEWIRDNISNFGGDPANVTIFGQSGGGGKVSTLMAMPAAKGLFHRAIVQSGSTLRVAAPDDSAALAAAVLKELSLTASQIGQLHDMPVERLCMAQQAVVRSMGPPSGLPRNANARRLQWGPTVDGTVLPNHPFDPAAPAVSADVPMLIGTNLNEFVNGVDNPEAATLTNEELTKRITERYGDKGRKIIEAYRREYPHASPFGLFSVISIAPTRQNAFTQADRKAKLGAAPAYQYLFAWQTPVLDGRPGAFHSCEIAFVFDNAELCVNYTGALPEALALSTKVSRAWINFARHGNPNHSGLPNWPAYTEEKRQTMIFDNECIVKNDPEGAGRRIISEG